MVIAGTISLRSFVVWGWVIDKKTLNIIAASVLSFAGAVLPVIVALMPDRESRSTQLQANASAACGLTDVQVSMVRSVMQQREPGCSYGNLTLDAILNGQ